MVYKLPKLLSEEVVLFAKDNDSRPRGKWMPVTVESLPFTGRRGKIRFPLVFCPACRADNLLVNHQVNPDGMVLPEFTCGAKCGFREWIELEGINAKRKSSK